VTSTKKSRRRGFILIYVAAMVAALTIILLQLNQLRTGVPRQAEKQVARAIEGGEARALLDFVVAGLAPGRNLEVDSRYMTFRRLLLQDPARFSELGDALSQLKLMLDQIGFKLEIGGGRATSGGSTSEETIAHDGEGILFAPRREAYVLTLGERTYRVRRLPGNALPNLSGLPFEALRRHLIHLGIPETEARELAANLVDWRDADGFRTDQVGAEQEYYLGLDRPYRPRNAPFAGWGEVAYVRGVTPDRLHLLRENFMLGSTKNPTVLADYLAPDVLANLAGVKPDVMLAVLREFGRQTEPGKEGDAGGPDIASVVLPADAEAIDRAISWKPDEERIRIVIEGPDSTLHADYDLKAKRWLGRW
jgi:hypothetical protein